MLNLKPFLLSSVSKLAIYWQQASAPRMISQEEAVRRFGPRILEGANDAA